MTVTLSLSSWISLLSHAHVPLMTLKHDLCTKYCRTPFYVPLPSNAILYGQICGIYMTYVPNTAALFLCSFPQATQYHTVKQALCIHRYRNYHAILKRDLGAVFCCSLSMFVPQQRNIIWSNMRYLHDLCTKYCRTLFMFLSPATQYHMGKHAQFTCRHQYSRNYLVPHTPMFPSPATRYYTVKHVLFNFTHQYAWNLFPSAATRYYMVKHVQFKLTHQYAWNLFPSRVTQYCMIKHVLFNFTHQYAWNLFPSRVTQYCMVKTCTIYPSVQHRKPSSPLTRCVSYWSCTDTSSSAMVDWRPAMMPD